MTGPMGRFEQIARSAPPPADAPAAPTDAVEAHPFEARNIHPDLPPRVRTLFDDGHLEQAVFEAFKFIEKDVKRVSQITGKSGFALMMDAFNEERPKIRLNQLSSESEIDEQKGYRFIFTGAATGIRNPRGHELEIGDSPDEALDYIGLASLLLRRLDAAGVR